MPLQSHNVFHEIPTNFRLDINPYVNKLKEARYNKSLPVLLGSDLVGRKGKWLDTFRSFHYNRVQAQKIVLEIGVHKGQVICNMAKQHPDYAFVGMDITYKRVFLTAQKAQQHDLHNILCLLANAKNIEELFGEDELDGVVVFFPDPWSKKKSQLHHRLIDENLCRTLMKIIKPQGFFWLKTDDKSYFSNVSESLDKVGFYDNLRTQGLPNELYESVFEKRFREKNVKIYEGTWENNSS